MKDRRLIEQIDACRPGSDDLRDPALVSLAAELADDTGQRSLYNRVQALDQAIGRAMEDVPLPAGLSERLLAGLAANQITAAAAEAEAALGTSGNLTPLVKRPSRAWRWSKGLTAAGLTAASVAAVLAIATWMRPPALTAATLKVEVLQYRDEPLTGEPTALTVPVGYPLSQHVHRLPQTMWRPIYGFLHRDDLNGVAYDLNFNGDTATLYVVQTQIKNLPPSPPLRSGVTTGNVVVVAWQESGLLYVLVVNGEERAYQGFVRKPTVG